MKIEGEKKADFNYSKILNYVFRSMLKVPTLQLVFLKKKPLFYFKHPLHCIAFLVTKIK